MNKNNYALLMAGGVGSRFWPVSTVKKPKQFLDLLGSGETLLQTTFKRLAEVVPVENIYILTNKIYEALVQEQLPEIKKHQILLEPTMRNTAPAVLLAALKIKKRNENAVMVMAPSDHWIEDHQAFSENIHTAIEASAEKGAMLTLGIQPTFPNTGYGYIKYEKGEKEVKKVTKFTEKPDFNTAKKFLKEGNYVWNSGIFIWSVATILASFKRNLPAMYALFSEGKSILNTSEEEDFIAGTYPQAENISIDYGILEKEHHVFMIPARFSWNDLGTWGSLYNELEKDTDENVIINARVCAENASGNIISTASNKVVVVAGLKDYIIIDQEEILLLVPKEKEQEIKQIKAKVQEKFGQDLG